MINFDVMQRTQRHRRPLGITWILHDGQSAGTLDFAEPNRTVVQRPAQNHADRATAVRDGGTAKQRVDGGTVAMLASPAGDRHAAASNCQVKSCRRDVDPPRSNWIAVSRVPRWQ